MKNTEKKIPKNEINSKSTKDNQCKDKLCPNHGEKGSRLKLRGRIFEGEIIRKFPGRVTISFERTKYISKYERYEKRKTKIHARLPDCLKDEMNIGDIIQVQECRPLSKIMSAVAIKVIKRNSIKEAEK